MVLIWHGLCRLRRTDSIPAAHAAPVAAATRTAAPARAAHIAVKDLRLWLLHDHWLVDRRRQPTVRLQLEIIRRNVLYGHRPVIRPSWLELVLLCRDELSTGAGRQIHALV